MSQERTLEVHQRGCPVPGCTTHDPERELFSGLQDAIDMAAERQETTVLLDHGKPIAVIGPVPRSTQA